MGFCEWENEIRWHQNISCDWVLLNICHVYARTPHFRALSLPVILSLALMCNSSDKIIVSQLFCNKGQASPCRRSDQNQFETILERHRCCVSACLSSISPGATIRCLAEVPSVSQRRLRSRKDDRPGRTRASNPSATLLFASGIGMIDDVQYGKSKMLRGSTYKLS